MRHATTLPLLAASVLFTIGCSSPKLDPTHKVDRIVVLKSAHTMTLYSAGQASKTYKVSLGRGHGSAKERQGDHETPEGKYLIDAKNVHSRFHLALHVSYPNAEDQARAKALALPTGGDIMIHGTEPKFAWLGRLQHDIDWTDGCIALTNPEMDEVWKAVPTGTPIEIRH
jgi:murein L,D-transpeptidase YafK